MTQNTVFPSYFAILCTFIFLASATFVDAQSEKKDGNADCVMAVVRNYCQAVIGVVNVTLKKQNKTKALEEVSVGWKGLQDALKLSERPPLPKNMSEAISKNISSDPEQAINNILGCLGQDIDALQRILVVGVEMCPKANPASIVPVKNTPTASEIQIALQADLDNRLSVLDNFASQCDNVGQTQNPLSALMCMGTGFGTFNSDSMKMTIRSVKLDECVVAQDGKAFCRYAVDVDSSQGAASSQLAPLIGMFRNSAVYGSFVKRSSAWVFYESYSNCRWGNGSISCSPAQ